MASQIATQLSISEEEAERMKHDLGTMAPGGSVSMGGMPSLLESAVLPMVNEIRYAIEVYGRMDTADSKRVEKVIITGGSAHLPKLADYLSQTLNMNVYVGDPWARVIYPEELRPVLDEVGPRLSVAVGLAMRDID